MDRDSLYWPNGGSSVKTVIYTRINWKIKKVLKQLNIVQKEIFAIDKEFACIYIIYITYMIFEWNENKAKTNFIKHKVTFEEAQTVFYDENALLLADEKHSDEEERFILMGISSMMNTLLVCFCERGSEENEIIRIISSRKANKKETEQYWKRRLP